MPPRDNRVGTRRDCWEAKGPRCSSALETRASEKVDWSMEELTATRRMTSLDIRLTGAKASVAWTRAEKSRIA